MNVKTAYHYGGLWNISAINSSISSYIIMEHAIVIFDTYDTSEKLDLFKPLLRKRGFPKILKERKFN